MDFDASIETPYSDGIQINILTLINIYSKYTVKQFTKIIVN